MAPKSRSTDPTTTSMEWKKILMDLLDTPPPPQRHSSEHTWAQLRPPPQSPFREHTWAELQHILAAQAAQEEPEMSPADVEL